MNKAIFLDRDGVINEDPGYVHKIKDFKLVPGAIEALRLLKDFKFVIITNQSGIGRGYYNEEDFHKFNNYLVNELEKYGIHIDKTYFCPHTKEDNCNCRKPKIRFIEQAEKDFDLDIKNSFVIGDHPCDIELGKNAGCRTVHVLTGHGPKHKEEVKQLKPDYIAKDILEAAKWIIKQK